MNMLDWIEANWLVFGAVLLLVLLIAWWIWSRARQASRIDRRRAETPDVLTPGAAPAERNSLLLDAPPAASFTATAQIAGISPDIMGGMGEVIAVAAARNIEAEENRDASAAEPTAAPAETDADADADMAADDLTRIKGVGPKLGRMLGELGIRRYDQIAAWTEADIARIDPQLGPFQGRIARDNWVDQCRYLASGDIETYEARYGKL